MTALQIVKIGGNVIDDKKLLQSFLKSFSELEGLKILVHGGGKVATSIADSLGIATAMIDGRRITTDEMIDVVTMTYGGLINKQMVSSLQRFDVNAVGLSGADGNLILSKKRPIKDGVDFGWVGDPELVNVDWLLDLLATGITPVVAPLTHDGAGHLLNTNADTIATVLAISLSMHFKCELNFCFEMDGVLQDRNDPNSLIKDLNQASYQGFKQAGTIANGMIPKLDNAFEALRSGVSKVRVMNFNSIANLKNKDFNECTTIH